MLSYRHISFLIAGVLLIVSPVAIASDENPWSMDAPGEGQQPYYDLNSSGPGGFVDSGQRAVDGVPPRSFSSGQPANESTVPKSLPNGERIGWQSAPGKGSRDEVYGYAGPQVERPQRDRRSTARIGKGIRFGGKNYGAFAPIEPRANVHQRQPAQNIQGNVQGIQRSRAKAFANVPPPLIPDAAPAARLLPYPYGGYGRSPGYGLPYGTRIAPYAGNGAQGPTLSNPGMPPGAFGPGFMW